MLTNHHMSGPEESDTGGRRGWQIDANAQCCGPGGVARQDAMHGAAKRVRYSGEIDLNRLACRHWAGFGLRDLSDEHDRA
jgi:hypothetical protein